MFKTMFFDWLFPFSKWTLLGFVGEGEGGSGDGEGDGGAGDGDAPAAGAGDGGEGDGDDKGGEGDPAGQGDGSVEDFSDPDFDYESWLDKRGGAKSVAKELARIKGELAKAKTPKAPERQAEPPKVPGVQKSIIEALMGHPKGKQAIEHLKSVKLQDRDIESLVELAEIVADAKVRQGTSRYADRMARAGLKDVITELGQKDEYKFIVSKYSGEVESELKRMKVSPEFWEDPLVVEQALRSIGFAKLSKKSASGDDGDGRPPKKVSEGGDFGAGSGGSGGLSNAEVHEYAANAGIKILDREGFNNCRAALIARNKAMAIREGAANK
jgi:hypothetical protein